MPADGELANQLFDRYVTELNSRIEAGFDPARSSSAAPDPAELSPPHGDLLVGYLGDEAVCCGGLKQLRPDLYEVKRMWVSPELRGLGIGSSLLDALEARASELGARALRLDTSRELTEAQRLYRRAGYYEIERYNDNPFAALFFEKPLA